MDPCFSAVARSTGVKEVGRESGVSPSPIFDRGDGSNPSDQGSHRARGFARFTYRSVVSALKAKRLSRYI